MATLEQSKTIELWPAGTWFVKFERRLSGDRFQVQVHYGHLREWAESLTPSAADWRDK